MNLKLNLSLFFSTLILVVGNTQNTTTRLSIESFYADINISKSQDYNPDNFRDVYPYDPNDLINRGIEKYEAGFYEEALVDFNESLDLTLECASCHYFRGINYLQLDSIHQAKSDLKLAIKYDPLLIDAYNDLSFVYRSENKLDSAKITLKEGIKHYPSHPLTYYNLGIVEIMRGKTKRALKQFKYSVEKDSCFSEAYNMLFTISVYDNNFSKAETYLNKNIACNPDNPLVYLWKALIKMERKKEEEAIENMTKVIELSDSNQTLYATRALFKLETKEYSSALQDFHTAFELKPIKTKSYRRSNSYKRIQYELEYGIDYYLTQNKNSPNATLDELFGLIINKEYKKVKKKTNKLLKSKNDIFLRMLLAMAEENLGNYKKAEALYSMILEEDPNFIEAYRKRGLIRQELQNLSGAVDDFNKMYKLHSNADLALKYRGIVKVQQGNVEEARNDFQAITKVNASDMDIFFNKGQCEMHLGLYKEAIFSFERIIDIQPDDLRVLFAIANCHSFLRNPQATINTCDSILAYQKCHMQAQNLKGITYVEISEYEKALPCFDQMISCLPNDLDARINRAVVLMQLKKLDKALVDVNKVIALYPKIATAYYLRAKIDHQLGRPFPCHDLNKAIKLGHTVTQQEINDICK